MILKQCLAVRRHQSVMMMNREKDQLVTDRAFASSATVSRRLRACDAGRAKQGYFQLGVLLIVFVISGMFDGLASGYIQINIGDKVEGRLDEGDKKLPDGSFYDFYFFLGNHGQKVTIDLQSAEFDPYLSVLDKDGTEIASDNDSGGDHNARIKLTLSYSGKYYLRVNSLKKEGKGKYLLELK